jgi:hypothetical protein
LFEELLTLCLPHIFVLIEKKKQNKTKQTNIENNSNKKKIIQGEHNAAIFGEM